MKQVKYILDKNHYKFDPENGLIYFNDDTLYKGIQAIGLITNVTTNTIIYNPHCEGFGGSLSEANSIIFDYDVSSMSEDDELIVYKLETIERTKQDDTILKEILTELKILKLHYQYITDEIYTDSDIEE